MFLFSQSKMLIFEMLIYVDLTHALFHNEHFVTLDLFHLIFCVISFTSCWQKWFALPCLGIALGKYCCFVLTSMWCNSTSHSVLTLVDNYRHSNFNRCGRLIRSVWKIIFTFNVRFYTAWKSWEGSLHMQNLWLVARSFECACYGDL